LGIAVTPGISGGIPGKQAIAFQIKKDALEQMTQIEQAITTPLQHFEFVVQAFHETAGVSVDKAHSDGFCGHWR